MGRKSKFTDSQIIEMQDRHNNGESMRSIARMMKVSDATIRQNIKARGIKDTFGQVVINHKFNKSPDVVYIITSDEFENEGIYKIGITSNLDYRIKQMQTGCPYLLRAVISSVVKNPNAIEFMLHSFFIKKRISGEWFLLNNTDIEYIKSALVNMSEDYVKTV